MTKVFEALKYDEAKQGTAPDVSPAMPAGPAKREPRLDIREAMTALYQGIASALPASAAKIIQLVASREGEGTSTIVRELARVGAVKMGKSVLVLDANRTNPVQHHFFNAYPKHYLEDVLKNGRLADEAFGRWENSKLFVGLVSRETTPIQDVFDSSEIHGLFETLKERFDLIVIDSPSVTAFPDCLSICCRVDGVVLVVEAENTRWPVAEAARDLIARSGGTLLGMVLNKRQFYIPKSIYRRL